MASYLFSPLDLFFGQAQLVLGLLELTADRRQLAPQLRQPGVNVIIIYSNLFEKNLRSIFGGILSQNRHFSPGWYHETMST
jgi:hypothetical protein